MELNLDGLRANAHAEVEAAMPEVFKNVNLILILPDGGEVNWPNVFAGESLLSIKKRLHDEHHYAESSKLYLEEKSQKTYMLDPLSLNDFPRIQELVNGGHPVRIIVDGQKEN